MCCCSRFNNSRVDYKYEHLLRSSQQLHRAADHSDAGVGNSLAEKTTLTLYSLSRLIFGGCERKINTHEEDEKKKMIDNMNMPSLACGVAVERLKSLAYGDSWAYRRCLLARGYCPSFQFSFSLACGTCGACGDPLCGSWVQET